MKKTTDICYNLSRRKRVRVVEGARLERVYTAMYRRFESSRFRQEVKKDPQGYFLFLRRRNEDSSPGSHGAKRHPLILSLPEGMKKRPARVFFVSARNEDSSPRIPLSRYSKIKLPHSNSAVSSLNIAENHHN